MEEEIDIIELFKRVKEGKAPEWIEVGGNKYKYFEDMCSIETLYIDNDGDGWLHIEEIDVCTKIKILDKPIIEEIHKKYNVSNPKELKECVEDLGGKINEIIRRLNNGLKTS